jgi:peptidoglycan/xylan/chitin deacetylase (PgdA/CDA1 family)
MLLFCGIFAYGAFLLMVEIIERVSRPAPRHVITKMQEPATTPPVKEIQTEPVVAEKPTQEIPVNTPTAHPVGQALAASGPNPAKIQEIQAKYKNINPSEWGERTNGIVHKVNFLSAGNNRTLFLTINAYSNHQEELFAYLNSHNIKATVFVSGYYVRRNSTVLQNLSQNPLFDIQNLGNRNRALSVNGASVYNIAGTATVYEAISEVLEGAKQIQGVTGKWPAYYRSATGYTDDIAVRAITDLGIKVIGYNKVTDGGGLISVAAIKENILEASNGTILVISINLSYPNILKGLQAAIEEIENQKLPIKFELLSDYDKNFSYIH